MKVLVVCGQTVKFHQSKMNSVSLLPIFPLDLVLFPGAPLPLHIFEPRYKEMINECLKEKRAFGMVRARENAVAEVGCTAVVVKVTKTYDDGRLEIEAEGKQRFSILQLNHERSFLQAEVAFFDDEEQLQAAKPEQDSATALHQELMEVLGQGSELERNPAPLSFRLAQELPVDLDFKQALLEMKSEPERIETLIEYYKATIPKVKTTLKARERASGNGHVR